MPPQGTIVFRIGFRDDLLAHLFDSPEGRQELDTNCVSVPPNHFTISFNRIQLDKQQKCVWYDQLLQNLYSRACFRDVSDGTGNRKVMLVIRNHSPLEYTGPGRGSQLAAGFYLNAGVRNRRCFCRTCPILLFRRGLNFRNKCLRLPRRFGWDFHRSSLNLLRRRGLRRCCSFSKR